MNKIAKTALMTGTALCVAGVVLSTAGYFAGGKDFTYASDHVYVSGGNSSVHKNLAVMKKEQIDDFTKLNVDFEDLDLDIRLNVRRDRQPGDRVRDRDGRAAGDGAAVPTLADYSAARR